MERCGLRAWKWWMVIAFLPVLVPGSARAANSVRVERHRRGAYRASVTYVPFSANSAVAALANHTLRADAEKGIRDFVRQTERERRESVPVALRLPYEHQADGTIALDRPDLSSAYLTTYEFLGGAHGMTGYTAVNAGRVRGRVQLLRLQDLFRPGVPAAQVAAQRVREHLTANPRAAWFAPDADPSDRPKDADLIANFVITPTGLTFLIPPYVAGPYAAGSFFVKVPFSEFAGKLDPVGPLGGLLSKTTR